MSPDKRMLSFGIWVHTSDFYLWGDNVQRIADTVVKMEQEIQSPTAVCS